MEFGRNVSVMTPPTDLEKWDAVGPVRTIRRETASWDSARGDWGVPGQPSEADFRPDGRLVEERFFNPDGSLVHTSWTYDGAGRAIQSRQWTNTSQQLTRFIYDADGRPARSVDVAADGSERVAETWGEDSLGRRSKVRFLQEVVAPDHGMVLLSYTVPGATTTTTTYDEHENPIEILSHDANHALLFTVTFTRDRDGHVLIEEARFVGDLPFARQLDERFAAAPEEDREKARRLLTMAFDDGRLSTVEYQRDSDGRIVSSIRRMGVMNEERTTCSYDSHGNLTEEINEQRSSNISLDESGAIVTHEEAPTCNHYRFDYVYDERGNWTEKVGWVKIGEDFTRVNIERREFSYYMR